MPPPKGRHALWSVWLSDLWPQGCLAGLRWLRHSTGHWSSTDTRTALNTPTVGVMEPARCYYWPCVRVCVCARMCVIEASTVHLSTSHCPFLSLSISININNELLFIQTRSSVSFLPSTSPAPSPFSSTGLIPGAQLESVTLKKHHGITMALVNLLWKVTFNPKIKWNYLMFYLNYFDERKWNLTFRNLALHFFVFLFSTFFFLKG